MFYIFRNSTVENLFQGTEAAFSGYGDLAAPAGDFELYLWFFLPPVHFDAARLTEEIDSYSNQLNVARQQLPKNKPLVVFTLPIPDVPCIAGTHAALEASVQAFNRGVQELAGDDPMLKVIDFAAFVREQDAAKVLDWKYYFMSKMQISPFLAKPFRAWFDQQLRRIRLIRKKCLVLDLDNTLWGGVLGEDGVNGIKIGGDYPGNAFELFQQGLLECYRNGVILTVCSKNNEADVLDAWENNPFLTLKKEHFAAYRINWNNKADNIRALAAELNIGLDSLVFIDDSPQERELVRQQLPMVDVPDFPVQPYELPNLYRMLVNEYFSVDSLTSEDQDKTRQYRENADRSRFEQTCTSLEDFIRSLDIELTIAPATDATLPRIAQLSQKTNQFNLTTRRYTEDQIRAMLNDGAGMYTLSVKDRFGDSGLTGVFIGCPADERVEIDSFLLSCRVLGKEIEKAFLATVLNCLRESGHDNFGATFLPTLKNEQVKTFYERCGFEPANEEPDGSRHYTLSLEAPLEIEPLYTIEVIP